MRTTLAHLISRRLAVLAILLFALLLGALSFSPQQTNAAGWYDNSWPARILLTVNSSKVTANQTNFPVYVNLADLTTDFWAGVRSDCGDIRVTSSDGTTEIPREVVTCSTSGHTGELWFKASSISSSSNTNFYIYYGKASATDYATNATYGAQNVWDSNYKGVWHMKDGTTLSVTDSTANANNGTKNGSPSATAGEIDGAANFAGSSDNMLITSISLSGVTYTISTWFNAPLPNSTCSGYCTLVRGSSDHPVLVNPSHLLGEFDNVGGTAFHSSGFDMTTLSSGWHYLTAEVSGSNTVFYIDGSSVGTSNIKSNDNILYVGNYQGGGQPWGKTDEFRVSNIARSSTWISTEYNNQSAPSTFYTATQDPGYHASITLTKSAVVTGGAAVLGTLSKGSGTFVIDDPLNPRNELLFHSFVESPDVMNIYDGIAQLDGRGDATVVLPNYFIALNNDFRYLATAIGQPMPDLYLSSGVKPEFLGLFGAPVLKIAGGVPNGKISWQVTGIRHDPYILANPITTVVDKGPGQLVDKGSYVCPECYTK